MSQIRVADIMFRVVWVFLTNYAHTLNMAFNLFKLSNVHITVGSLPYEIKCLDTKDPYVKWTIC